jgi:hypothetical protein
MSAARADGGSHCRGEGGLWGENERAWGLATGREWLSHERRRVAHPDGKGKKRKERTMWSEAERGLEGGECETRSSSASQPVQGPPPRLFMLSLPSRSLFSIRTPSHVICRRLAAATIPTRRDTDTVDRVAASNNSLDQITDILDDADLSTSPRSKIFSGKPSWPPQVNSPHLMFLAL